MKVREKEPADQPWIETLLNGRWRGGNVVVHGETFDARSLPALIAGEGGATFQIERSSDIAVAELITLDALTAGRGVGTALIGALISRLQAARVEVLALFNISKLVQLIRC